MFAPTLQAPIGFGPLLPGSGGINLESVGWSCDMEEEGHGFDLQSGKLPCNNTCTMLVSTIKNFQQNLGQVRRRTTNS